MISLKSLFALLILPFASLLSVFTSVGAAEFKFTAIPDQDTARLQQRFDKVAEYLTEQLGFKVSYVPVKSYSASVQAFKNNDVQMAWFGGLSGVQARLAVAKLVPIGFLQRRTRDHDPLVVPRLSRERIPSQGRVWHGLAPDSQQDVRAPGDRPARQGQGTP